MLINMVFEIGISLGKYKFLQMEKAEGTHAQKMIG